ncbi:DUF6884 domain-containing protein [Chloroflexota bacterium]
MKQALILSCSKAKRGTEEGNRAAINVYDGPMFRILRQYKPHLDVYILSARYGLIEAIHPILSYDLTLKDVPMREVVVDAHVQGRQIAEGCFDLMSYNCIYAVMGLNYLRWLLMILDVATKERGTALSYFNSLRLPTLACSGIGQMQRVLVDICAENVNTKLPPPAWHRAVEQYEKGTK